MNRQSPIRRYARIAVVLILVFFALRSTYRVSRRAVRAHAKAPRDRVEASEDRFARVRGHLPHHGTVEYRCLDRNDKTDAVRDRYLAQYALAPLVLDPIHAHDWIIEDRPARPDAPRAPPADGFELVLDAGNGIRIYRRIAP